MRAVDFECCANISSHNAQCKYEIIDAIICYAKIVILRNIANRNL